jgi:dihydrodipicolinate synthase/N-acetylneuraminate lyase
MLTAKGTEATVDTAKRWRDLGGSHVSVNTMGQNFTTTDQHLDYIKKVADALDQAGLKLT